MEDKNTERRKDRNNKRKKDSPIWPFGRLSWRLWPKRCFSYQMAASVKKWIGPAGDKGNESKKRLSKQFLCFDVSYRPSPFSATLFVTDMFVIAMSSFAPATVL